MGAVAVMGAIGGLLAGRNGRWMALVAAASPTLLWAASVSRGYAMVLLLTASSLYFFLRLTVIDTPQPRRDLSSPARPVVALLIDTQGEPLPLPHHVDLAQRESPSIVRTLSGIESRELLGGRFPEWV